MSATMTAPAVDQAADPDASPIAVHPFAEAGHWRFNVVCRPPARAEADALQREGWQVAEEALTAARSAFFAEGGGAAYRALAGRVRDAEAAATAAESETDKLRARLAGYLRDDDAPNVEKTEKALATATVNAARLAARLPLLRADLAQTRVRVAGALRQELDEALTALRIDAEGKEAAARAVLADAVERPFLDWLRAKAELDGVVPFLTPGPKPAVLARLLTVPADGVA